MMLFEFLQSIDDQRAVGIDTGQMGDRFGMVGAKDQRGDFKRFVLLGFAAARAVSYADEVSRDTAQL